MLQKRAKICQKSNQCGNGRFVQNNQAKKAYKTNREDLGDPDPYKVVGKQRGKGIEHDLADKLTDTLPDLPKYEKYKQDLDKYAWEHAQIFGPGGTLGQFLLTLGLSQYGSGTIDKGKDKLTKIGVAGSPWHVDFKKGIELLKDHDLWKIPH